MVRGAKSVSSQEMVGKATRPGSQFDDVDRLVVIDEPRFRHAVTDEPVHYPRVGLRNKGVAGDVTRHNSLAPGVDSLGGVVAALQVPENRPRQALRVLKSRRWHSGLRALVTLLQGTCTYPMRRQTSIRLLDTGEASCAEQRLSMVVYAVITPFPAESP
jgi:hypothetical protein